MCQIIFENLTLNTTYYFKYWQMVSCGNLKHVEIVINYYYLKLFR